MIDLEPILDEALERVRSISTKDRVALFRATLSSAISHEGARTFTFRVQSISFLQHTSLNSGFEAIVSNLYPVQ